MNAGDGTFCIHFKKPQMKFKNVAVNGVLPLKATRRDATANLKCFWGSGH